MTDYPDYDLALDDPLDPSTWPHDTFGYRRWRLEREARAAGATDVLASLDQLDAKMQDHRMHAIFGTPLAGVPVTGKDD